jgi:hypothetical protein
MDPETRLKNLETLAQVAAETLTAIGDWLGNASTREAAEDSIRRLWRVLQAVGFDGHVRENLGWRGSLLRAMDRAGIGYGEDDEIRLRTAGDLPWMRATGPRVKDLLADLSELPRGIDGEEMCPRCGREQLWIDAEVQARLSLTTGAGESAFEVMETELIDEVVWQRDQGASCPACGWKGTLGDVMDFLGTGGVSTFSALKRSRRAGVDKPSK